MCLNNERGFLYVKGKVGVNVMIYYVLIVVLFVCVYKVDIKNIVIVFYFRLRWIFYCLDMCIKCISNVDILFWDLIFN